MNLAARSAALGCAAMALTGSTSALAGSGALLGEASRTASLADAVTARHGEPSAIYFNPGALADLDRPALTLGGHVGSLELYFQRHGEEAEDRSRLVAGWSVAVATPLPGPWWLRALRFGLALHLPVQHALRLVAPEREDVPTFPLYGDRAERTALSAALAIELFHRIGIGAGISLSPHLSTPSLISYQPGRGETVQDNVVTDLDRELQIGASALFGVRAQVHRTLALGLAYRQRTTTSAAGPNDTQAGSLRVDDRIDFYDLLEPDELSVGAAAFPGHGLSASIDLVRARWSAYRTIHNEVPVPRFSDVHYLRAGLEQRFAHGLALRAGYAYEPSPVSPQIGVTNLLDADRHVLALGGGWDLDAMDWAPLRFDLDVRAHLLATQRADKQLAALPDADREAPGKQIDNFGYPGFTAGGGLWQIGLTATVWLGDAKAAREDRSHAPAGGAGASREVAP